MSITTEINRIKTAKNNLMTAINNKGGSLTSSSKLEDFVTSVEEDILTSIEIPSGTCFAYSTWRTIPLFILDYMNTLTAIPNNFLTTSSISGTLRIPSSVTSIGTSAFLQCSGLTSITIPSSVTNIGAHAFLQCSGLTSITIPSSVTSIGTSAFLQCSNLNSVIIPLTITRIESSTFSDCSRLTSVTIPNSVTTIENNAFYNCTSLSSVTIPSSVTTITLQAFYNCTSLSSITVKATTPPSILISTFNNTNNCPIYVPAESVDAYKAATNWSSYASRIQAIQGGLVVSDDEEIDVGDDVATGGTYIIADSVVDGEPGKRITLIDDGTLVGYYDEENDIYYDANGTEIDMNEYMWDFLFYLDSNGY